MAKITYSPDVDALLIELLDKPIDHAQEVDSAIIHYSAIGQPVLLEILDARKFILTLLETVLIR